MIYVLLLALFFLVLYYRGFLPVSVKRSRSFIGTMGAGKNHCEAAFTECHGSVHRVVRFSESRTYSFRFAGHVQKGLVTAQVLDSRRNPILTLNTSNPTALLAADRHKPYYLYIHFTNATGDFQLDWA